MTYPMDWKQRWGCIRIPFTYPDCGSTSYTFFWPWLRTVRQRSCCWRRSPSLAGFGFVCFLLWGFVELSGVSVNIFAVNADWRAHFAAATPEGQGQLRVLLLGFDAVWDALFFLLLTGFLLGTTCFGLAALAGTGLERWVGIMFLWRRL